MINLLDLWKLFSFFTQSLPSVSVTIIDNADGAYSTAIYNAAASELAERVDNLGEIDHVMYVLPVSTGQSFGPVEI